MQQHNYMQQNQFNNGQTQFNQIQPKHEEEEFDDENSSQSNNDNIGADGKKKYSVISQNVREQFIQRVLSKEVTIKEAAKEFGIKFSTSKAILQTYKKEGRIGKKKTRQRKPKNDISRNNSHPTPPQNNNNSLLSQNQQQQFQQAQRLNHHAILSPNLNPLHMTPQQGFYNQQKSLIPGLGDANLAPLPIYKANNSLIAKKKDSFSLDIMQQQQQQQYQQQHQQLQQSPQIDKDMQNTIKEIKNTIQNKQGVSNSYNNQTNSQGQQNYNYSYNVNNISNNNNSQFGQGLILNKLNKSKLAHRPLSVDTGNNIISNSPSLRSANKNNADGTQLFPNPFNDNGNINQFYRESPFDLNQIKSQLSNIDVDYLKKKTYGLLELGDETDFNYNQYFSQQEIY